MIETMLTVLGGATGGGLIGLAGTALQAALKWAEAKQAAAREIELRRLDIEEKRLDIEQAERLAQYQMEAARLAAGAAQARAEAEAGREVQVASYASDRASYSDPEGRPAWVAALLGVVDVVRGLMRPGITLYTLGLLTWIGSLLHTATGGAIAGAADLWQQIVLAVVSLTTTCVVWWFGSRQMRG